MSLVGVKIIRLSRFGMILRSASSTSRTEIAGNLSQKDGISFLTRLIQSARVANFWVNA